ncbi:unnamed protein product [Euphydryas editha]|uniref:Uncharacterized protein n=1 Tax=Euphydryas editha TaxID=104508 RepID=A0AAU9TVA8_EUPED|nr:unnamed protein product [Euphydryas editha]
MMFIITSHHIQKR